MQSLNATHGGVRGLAVLDVPHESLQPFVRNVRLRGYRADGQVAGIADVLQQSDSVVEKIHASHDGESFPHLSRSTFPNQKVMLPRMTRVRKSSKLAKLFGANLDKLMRHHRLSGNGVANAAKGAGIQIDPKTVNNARAAGKDDGMGDPTLVTVEEIAAGVSAAGVSIEPWQLFAPRFDPLRLPELRKRSGDASAHKSLDAYLDELVGLWPRMKPGRRASLLHQAYEWAMENQEGQAPPPHPPQASQRTR